MTRSGIIAALKSSLMDASAAFTAANDADFARHIDAAVADMHRVRARTLVGSVEIDLSVADYPAPADLMGFKSAIWGSNARCYSPWDKNYPGILPRLRVVEIGGSNRLIFNHQPTAKQIALFGIDYRFYYWASHVFTDTACSLADGDQNLLLLRAQAEAMKELALRDSVRPTQIGGGFGSQTKTGMPAALHQVLLTEWLEHAL